MSLSRNFHKWFVYYIGGNVYCATMCLTEQAEHFVEEEPVDVAPLRDLDTSSRAIQNMIERGNPRIPDIDWKKEGSKPSVVRERSGIRSGRTFVKRASLWSIERTKKVWSFGQWVKAGQTDASPDGRWWEPPDEDEAMESIPVSTPVAEVARIVAARIAESLEVDDG